MGLLIAIYLANAAVLALVGDPLPTFEPGTVGEPTPMPSVTWPVVAIFVPILGLGGFLLWTLVLLGLGRLFGGRARFASLFAALAFASAPPAIAGLPLQAIPADRLILALLSLPIFLALGIWSLVLSALAIREAHGISTGAAIGVMVIAFIAAIVVAVIIAFVAIALLVGGL